MLPLLGIVGRDTRRTCFKKSPAQRRRSGPATTQSWWTNEVDTGLLKELREHEGQLRTELNVELPLLAAVPAADTKSFFGTSPRMREIQSLIGPVGWSEAP
jgi:hypothetical protein